MKSQIKNKLILNIIKITLIITIMFSLILDCRYGPIDENGAYVRMTGTICQAKAKTSATNISKNIRIGYIYTGDSRIRRLNLTMNMKGMKDTWVYCKSGLGYSWFVCDSLVKIKSTINKHPKIDRWVLISGWGVNDLWNIETYLKKYKEIIKEYKDETDLRLYLMSVNPVSGRKRSRYTRIPYFNSRLKEFVDEYKDKGVYYIDTYSSLVSGGFSTIDGLHYTERTNRRIYYIVRKELDLTNAYMNYQELEINPGAERTISLKEVNSRTRWTVSDRRVARVTQVKGDYGEKVVITALKAGDCIVKAVANNTVYECKVCVTDTKPVIIYYSYTGNTETVAEYIGSYIGGDMICIEPYYLYPNKLSKLKKQVKKELNENARPQVENKGIDLTSYDEIYIGFPIWYGYAPRVIYSFLDSCTGLDGKDVYCFTTSDSGDPGDSITELQATYPGITVNACMNIESDNVLTSSEKKNIRNMMDGRDSD